MSLVTRNLAILVASDANISINVADSASAAELVTLILNPLLINVNDVISESELINVKTVAPVVISVSDSIAPTESVSLTFVTHLPPLIVSAFDTISITDYVDYDVSILLLHQWDVLQKYHEELLHSWDVLSDSIIVRLLHAWDVRASLFKMMHTWSVVPANIASSFDLAIQRPVFVIHDSLQINIADKISVSENAQFRGLPIGIRINDSITVTESVGTSMPRRPIISETILITEGIRLLLSPLPVTLAETITPSEQISVTVT